MKPKSFWNRRIWRVWLLSLGLIALAACGERAADAPGGPAAAAPPPAYADLVLRNGGIYTVDAERHWAEAAAVRDGVFVAVGAAAEVEPLVGPETRVIDLAGGMALPGFHDAHVHPLSGGLALLGCNLAESKSVEAIIEKVTGCATAGGDGWLQGYNFDLSLFGQDGPHKSLLDAIDSERPIILWAADGHSAWVNSGALERAGITAATPDPDLGLIERDADGSPSGTLRETAQELVRAVIPAPGLGDNFNDLRAGVRHLNSVGVTSFIEASVGEPRYAAYQALAAAGLLTARVVTSLTYEGGYGGQDGEEFERVLEIRGVYESGRLNNGAVKLFLDGVLEGETAALVDPYLGMDGQRGDLIFEPEALNRAVTRFDAMGLQVHMHAVGDRAVRAGLDAVEAARLANGPSDNRHHIAHLQLIHPDDIPRFAALGVTANFQALWAWPDKYITELNLPVVGAERVNRMYPIASVLRAGGRVVGGSDWDVSSANPLDAIETAVRRQNPDADDGPVLNEDERVSLADMIDAYTIDGAWLMHQADLTGSIEVGKRADVVVLDRNIFDGPPTAINEARVVTTLLDGETVWPRADAEDAAE